MMSKRAENVAAKRLQRVLKDNSSIPNYQFKQKHATTEQIHRVVDTMIQSAFQERVQQ